MAMRIRLPRTLFILSISSPMLLRPLQISSIFLFLWVYTSTSRQTAARPEQPTTRLRRILDSRSRRFHRSIGYPSGFILENLARDRFGLILDKSRRNVALSSICIPSSRPFPMFWFWRSPRERRGCFLVKMRLASPSFSFPRRVKRYEKIIQW